jgi:peroxiredoxin
MTMRPVPAGIIALFLLIISAPPAIAVEFGLEPGKYAPHFDLPDLSGKTIKLSGLKGSVVLLNFWSTLCAPCIAEMPSLNRLTAALKDDGLTILTVAIDSSDKPVREFIAKNKITLTVLLDREKEVFFDQYAAPTLPAAYLIDRHGTIVETFSGPQEWDSPAMKQRILNVIHKR